MLTPVALLVGLTSSTGVELVSAIDVETSHTSNIFLDSSEEWDVGLHTRGEIGLDVAPFWSFGYDVELSVFSQHDDLDAHFHELYAFVNPAWGEDVRTDLTVELSLATLKNDEAYASLDYLRPTLLVELGVEPVEWARFRLSSDVSYRWFYGASQTSAVDAWARGSGSVNLPSRTTLTVWTRMGARWFTSAGSGADDRDLQLEVGLHVGQGLWTKAGLQIDYVFREAFGPSGLLLQALTDAQVNNVGTEFLYSGHRATVGIKQMLGNRAFLQAFFQIALRDYQGWPAYDAAFAPTGEDRSDLRLSPGARFAWTLRTYSEGSPWPRLDAWAEYRYLSQRSSSEPFDTHAHLSVLSLRATW